MDREYFEKTFLGIERFELFLGVCAAIAVTVLAIATVSLVCLGWTLEEHENQRHKGLMISIAVNNFYHDLTRLRSDGVEQQTTLDLMASRAQKIVNDLNVHGKHLELEDFIQFTARNLQGVYNYTSNPHVKLDGGDLSGFTLSGLKLDYVSLRDAKLMDVDFSGVSLRNAQFQRANLEGAVFEGADVEGANFKTAKNLNLDSLKAALNWEKVLYDFKDE
ncbi:MAG: hypothetical protein ACI9S8_001189 [Chlamydiales bacterium]